MAWYVGAMGFAHGTCELYKRSLDISVTDATPAKSTADTAGALRNSQITFIY